jgi:hypothetical protein
MATLTLGRPQRDLVAQRDWFIISSDKVLTRTTTMPAARSWSPIPRIITSSLPEAGDTFILRRLTTLLLTRPRPTDSSPVDTIKVIDTHTVKVSGTWLNTGLLKHWITQLFEDGDAIGVRVVDSAEVREADLMPV